MRLALLVALVVLSTGWIADLNTPFSMLAVAEDEEPGPDDIPGSASDSLTNFTAEPEPVVEDEMLNIEDPRASVDGLSRVRCQLFGAWGDFCEYKNLCFDSYSTLLLTVPDDSPRLKVRPVPTRGGIRFTTKLPLWDPNPARKSPSHFTGTVKYIAQSRMNE